MNYNLRELEFEKRYFNAAGRLKKERVYVSLLASNYDFAKLYESFNRFATGSNVLQTAFTIAHMTTSSTGMVITAIKAVKNSDKPRHMCVYFDNVNDLKLYLSYEEYHDRLAHIARRANKIDALLHE